MHTSLDHKTVKSLQVDISKDYDGGLSTEPILAL